MNLRIQTEQPRFSNRTDDGQSKINLKYELKAQGIGPVYIET
jgi:hypothetical protein